MHNFTVHENSELSLVGLYMEKITEYMTPYIACSFSYWEVKVIHTGNTGCPLILNDRCTVHMLQRTKEREYICYALKFNLQDQKLLGLSPGTACTDCEFIVVTVLPPQPGTVPYMWQGLNKRWTAACLILNN